MKKVGLTGGVASGKSSVAIMLAAAGVPVLNLDEIGREIMHADRKLVAKVHAICGITDTRWNPARVREVLFNDFEIKKKVEQLLHPLIVAEFERRLLELETQGKKIVVCEAALLIEGGYDRKLDELIVVMSPRDVRKQRLMERDKISSDLAERILESQVNDSQRQSVATLLIQNTGNLEHLGREVQRLLDRWKKELGP